MASDLLLLNLGLCVVVHRLCGVWNVFGPILYVCALIYNTGTAGQNQFLGKYI